MLSLAKHVRARFTASVVARSSRIRAACIHPAAGIVKHHAPSKRIAVVRAAAEVPKEPAKVEAQVQGGINAASQKLQQEAAKLDLTQLVQYNFATQLVLAAISWGILFFTTHGAMAHGAKIGIGTIIQMFSVLLTAYSAFLSFGYFQKVKESGHSVLGGWQQLKGFYNHITLNFLGAMAAIVSLQASIGMQVMQTVTSSASSIITKKAAAAPDVGLQFLAQAASNTLLAHVVSILFLTLLVKKTTDSYEAIIELADKLRAGV